MITIKINESDLRSMISEAVENYLKESWQDKYDNAVNTLEYYSFMQSEGHRLSNEQIEQVEEIVDFLRDTDANDNPEQKEWIEIGKDILIGCFHDK